MSLGIGIKGPEGIVLAAESRVTLQITNPDGSKVFNNYDNATKILTFNNPYTSIGAVTYGLAVIGQRTAHSFLPEFEAQLPDKKLLTVEGFAKNLGEFYMQQWKQVMPKDYKGQPMTFVVAGFNEGEPYGRIYMIELPNDKITPTEKQRGWKNLALYGEGKEKTLID